MKNNIKKLPNSRVEISISASAEDIAPFFVRAYEVVGAELEIPGFRKGKAPKEMVILRVGKERVTSTALESAIPQTYYQAVMEQKLKPIHEPAVSVNKFSEDDGLEYVASVDVYPEVTLANYHRLKINRAKFDAPKIDPKEVESTIERLCKSAAIPTEIKLAAEFGHLVEVSYTGKVGGVIQPDLSNENHPFVLGEGAVIPEFEKEISGMLSGESKNFSIKVPKRGGGEEKQVDFELKVLKVSKLEIPAFDDQLAKQFKKETALELKKAIEDDLEHHKQEEATAALREAVISEVIKDAKIDLPESLIDHEIGHRLEHLANQLKHMNKTVETWLADQKKSMADLRNEMKPTAEKSAKVGLVLRAIAEAEGFAKAGEEIKPEVFEKTVDYLIEKSTK